MTETLVDAVVLSVGYHSLIIKMKERDSAWALSVRRGPWPYLLRSRAKIRIIYYAELPFSHYRSYPL